MAAVYDDEQHQREAEAAVDRINDKFLAWAQQNLIGQPVEKVSKGQVVATLKGLVKAELGQLQGAHKRPVVTPRRRP